MGRKLEKPEWRSYFDRMSKGLDGKRAEIEVASLGLGDQVAARWVPLIGIVYDHKDDIVEVALEGLDHLIWKPRTIYVEDDAGELTGFEVIDAEGTRQIVKLKEPVALPAPQH